MSEVKKDELYHDLSLLIDRVVEKINEIVPELGSERFFSVIEDTVIVTGSNGSATIHIGVCDYAHEAVIDESE